MRRRTRIISFLLAATVLFAQGNITAMAADGDEISQIEILQQEEITDVQSVEEQATYINPLYADEIRESDLEQVKVQEDEESFSTQSVEEVSDFTDVAQAAAYMRSQMKERSGQIVIGYRIDHADSGSLKSYMQQIPHSIADKAMEHTGDPTEGDYLRWQYAGWNSNTRGRAKSDAAYLTITYQITYYTSIAQENAMDSAVSRCLEELQLEGKSDYEKIRDIYAYVCHNISYDYRNLNTESYKLKYTAYAALMNRTAVCQGFSLLFYRLALENGIDARVITGYVYGDVNKGHAWNIVNLDGKYYALDASWDAECTQSGRKYGYFLRNAENFIDHTADAEYRAAQFKNAYALSAQDHAVDLQIQDNEVVSRTSAAGRSNEDCETLKAIKIKKLSGTSGKVKITWSKSTKGSQYEVYMSTKKNGTYKKLTTRKSTSYTKKKLKAGKTYYFKIRAVKKESGKKTYSPYSMAIYKICK